MKENNFSRQLNTLCFIGAGILLFIQLLAHMATPFMRDDLWYATNLVTGAKISSVPDIAESMIWHYYNWGGRIVNHAILQAVLSLGELTADLFNIIATALLGLVIVHTAKAKNSLMFLLSEALIVAFNASLFFSMLWESGSVNYLYSTSWILLYVMVIIKELDPIKETQGKTIAKCIWIIPLLLLVIYIHIIF